MLKIYEKLKTDAWRTAGARYNAARRLKRRDLFSTISLSLFSAAGVGLAVIQKVYNPQSGSPLDNYLTVLSVCLSVFLLVVSLIEWGAGNSVKADRLHQNAEELSAFWRRLDLTILNLKSNPSSQPNPADAAARLKEYDEIKAKCGFNHDPLDDHLFVASQRHADEFKKNGKEPFCWLEERWLTFRSHFSSVWYFVSLWLVIAILIYVTPWNQTAKAIGQSL
jgi:hypothetical protein